MALVDDWVSRSGFAIDFMQHFDLGDGLELDFSVESLRVLEAAVSERFAAAAEVLYDDEQPFVEGVVAYVGECLLRLSRGAWAWDDAPGFAERGQPPVANAELLERLDAYRWRWEGAEATGVPVVSADAVLGLTPVSPLHLLLAQVASGGALFSGTFAQWKGAVDAYVASHPEWVQVTEPTLTDGMPIMPPSPIMDAWLAEQARNFPAWAQKYGGTWDFSPESVDALAALVFRVTPTVAAFEDPANAEFYEGASWYFGEMLCRAYPSRWMYRGHSREPGDPATVCFTVQTNDNKDFTTPYRRLRLTLKRNDPARLRAGYDTWAE